MASYYVCGCMSQKKCNLIKDSWFSDLRALFNCLDYLSAPCAFLLSVLLFVLCTVLLSK